MAAALSGVYPALTTPFENGEVSVPKLKQNVEKFNQAGFTGYVVLGSTGESVLMNNAERIAAVKAVKEAAAPGKTIIAGTGMQSAALTIGFTRQAVDAGADYALMVTPFYYKGQMTARNLELYYREVADNVPVPVIIYNVPKFTGVDLPLDAVKALAEHPNIAGLKESSGNISFLGEILKIVPGDFAVLQGGGAVLYQSMVTGAQGGILALGNIAPKETVEVFDLFKAGDFAGAAAVQRRISTVNQKIVGAFGVPGIKYAVDLLGFNGGAPRNPLQPVSGDVKQAIKALLQDAGLL